MIGVVSGLLTLTEIEARLRDALTVISKLPEEGHKPYRPAWPEMLRDWSDWDKAIRVKRAVPHSKEIDEAFEALEWLSHIPPGDDTLKLVTARVMGASWPMLQTRRWRLHPKLYMRKLSERTLRQRYQAGLRTIQRSI